MDLSGRVALVTGASRGIGKAIAELLAERGALVVGTATSSKGVAEIDCLLAARGCGVVLDVVDEEAIKGVVDGVKSRFGSLDILVNNAGITCDNLLMRMKTQEWQRVLDVNLTALFHLAKAAVALMVRQRYGRFISIGSVVGSVGNPGQTNYAAAKAGLVGFSRSLAMEVAKRGVTVNVVSPGFVATDMVTAISEERRNAIANSVPVGRIGNVKEIAYAVAFLASDMAAYITGETLHVNGGLYMA